MAEKTTRDLDKATVGLESGNAACAIAAEMAGCCALEVLDLVEKAMHESDSGKTERAASDVSELVVTMIMMFSR